MKWRFPPDVSVVVFGPVLVVVVALGFGSIIFHAAEIGGSFAARAVILAVVLALLATLFFRRRRRP